MTESKQMSRRKLLGKLGAAGAVLAGGSLLPSAAFAEGESGQRPDEPNENSMLVRRSIPVEWVNVVDHGVVGDDVADDTASLQAAADEAVATKKMLYIPQGLIVKITSTVNLRYIRQIDSRGTIKSYVDHGVGVLVGNDSRNSNPFRLYFASVTKGGTRHADDIGIRVVGVKNAHITVMNCYYLQLYANASDVTMSSIAYSEFYLGRMINTLELFGEAGTSWINENTFYGGSMQKILLNSVNYSHNNNVFIKPCVEGANSIIQINKGVRNKFYDIRSEGSMAIELAAGTYYNVIIDNFISNPGNLKSGARITDLGQENFVLHSLEAYYKQVDVVRINRHSIILDQCAEAAHMHHVVRSGFDHLVGQANTILYETGIIPVGDITRFRFDSDSKRFRYRVYCYDENKQLLNDRLYINPIMGWSQRGDYAGWTTNVDTVWVVFNDPAVKYANMVIFYVGPGGFEYVRLTAFVKPSVTEQVVEDIRKGQRRSLMQSSKPSRGLVHPGQTVVKGDGSGVWVCTARIDTALTSAQPAGSTAVQVADASGMAVHDVFAVLLEDRTTHWTSITAVSGNTVTLANPLSATASVGGRAAAIRWV